MRTIIFDVKDRVGSPAAADGGEYVERVYSLIVVSFCSPGPVCKET